ncbi:expansin EXLX1 family cellulose-binding protein [Streptomyces sp. NPDC057740]|uniref:expansin EXLX1 family cellulose-binding protein n=1 Tax=Streptomyces sp. NPDC057740 TaxID=3346234 RepID=UPI0036AED61A
MASPSHRRSPSKWRGALVPAVVVAAVALAASLLMALRPDGTSTAGHTTTAPTADSRSAAPRTTPSPSPTPKPKPSKASPTADAKRTTPPPRTPTSAPADSAAKGTTPHRASGSAPLAGRIRPGTDYEGVATFYDIGNGDGACLYGPTADVMTAAMNHADYETAKACGAHVLVRAANGASVTVRITNECPLPCAPGQLDLSAQAFAKLAAPSAGRIPVTWSLLSSDTSAKVGIRYKTGSSVHWCGIQALDHRNPLARLEVRDAGGAWRRLPRTAYNYFLSEQGSGCGGAIRITDIYGETLTVEGISIRPDVVQPTRVQFAAR